MYFDKTHEQKVFPLDKDRTGYKGSLISNRSWQEVKTQTELRIITLKY